MPSLRGRRTSWSFSQRKWQTWRRRMERYVSGDLNIISRTHWPEKWYIKSKKKANYQMTCCPTSHFLRTNASPFEVDKKEDKIGEYWVSQHVAPLKVHSSDTLSCLTLNFTVMYLDSWTLCQPPPSLRFNYFNVYIFGIFRLIASPSPHCHH